MHNNNNRQHRIKEGTSRGDKNQAMQLNRMENVAAAVTMPSARNVRKDRRYLGKRMALLACKLGSSGTVVDEVVELSSGVVDDSSGVYRRLRGERNNKYTTIIAIQMQDITDEMQTGF